jgi:hypothetical protein
MLLAILFTLPAKAQLSQSGGIVTTFDPSSRALAMGGAGGAVFWGQDPNYWANPALLGYYNGIGYQHTKQPLVCGLADDVFLEADRFTLAAWGIGLGFSGKPFGKLKLDQGEQLSSGTGAQDPQSFNSYEEIEAFAAGVSLGRFMQSLSHATGQDIPALDFVDLGFGYTFKDVNVNLAPSSVTQDPGGDGGSASASTSDRGFFARLTPLNSLDPASGKPFPASLANIGVRLDLAYGKSVQNSKDAELYFVAADQADPIPRLERTGFAGRIALGGGRLFENLGLPVLGKLFTPLIQAGIAWDDIEESADGFSSTTETSGIEVTVLNVLAFRWGTVKNTDFDLDGDSSGWGLGLEFDRIGGFRYDAATRPQPSGLDDCETDAFTMYLDPLAAWEAWKTRD